MREKSTSILHQIANRKTIKKARITYHVIWNLFLLFFIIALLGSTFAAGIGSGYFASLLKDEPIRPYDSMKKDIYNYTETTNLYFADNVYLGKLQTDLEREEIKLDQISKFLIQGIIATEDEYFYQHHGVVPKAILRAMYQELANSAVKSGGSTITQQLIKNQLLTNEVSFQRKAKEIILALRLEKFFSKKEILEAYLNVATFGRNSSGRNIAGVQAAAKGLFGKNASELSLAQSAFIAGLPQSPFGYTPYTRSGELKHNLEPGISRMQTVLSRMRERGFITETEFSDAAAYDIKKDFILSKENPLEKYPWLTVEIEKRAINLLAEHLAKEDGYHKGDLSKNHALYSKYLLQASHDLKQKGYGIHTTINKDIYDAMEKAKDAYRFYGPDKPQKVVDPETKQLKTVMEPVEVGAMLIENKTGKIISFVGGRDHQKQQLNHATSAIRQNGSTMKPLLVYAPAIELGKASPGTVLPDVALSLSPLIDRPWPTNYDKRYNGLVTARTALAKSLNVPAVKLYTDIVGDRPAKYLKKMGFTTLDAEDYTNLATSIGSLKKGVTIEENTNAFSTFANGGKFIDAYLIDKILDKNGNVIYMHKTQPVTVFTPQTAYLTLDMMRDVIKKGTAAGIKNKLAFHSDWAGKTGTGVEFHDSWFVAFNPNITFGIWTGYDTPKSLETKNGLSYSQRTNYLWANLMNAAYRKKPKLIASKKSFKAPEGIVSLPYCAVSGLLPTMECSMAGLVDKDLYNVKFAPSIMDDSLIEGKFVKVGGRNYLSSSLTPSDFSRRGLLLSPDFLNRMTDKNFKDTSQLIPKKDRWAVILVSDSKLKENGKIPSVVTVKQEGKKLTWFPVPESDIIGYRVYRSGFFSTRVASIPAGKPLSFTAENGIYFVTAVDISGNESAQSNTVTIGSDKEINNEQPPI
ncbi:MAG: transglycosylase domain-containing protein, partial [Bacillota bacterium]|nr:transglycosylase domain-containing protein [Bacillota bacterium]